MNHFKSYSGFYIPYILFALTVTLLIITNDKGALHLRMTSFYTETGNVFFKHYTDVGGDIPFYVIGVLLFYRYRIALTLLITQLGTGLIAQSIKRLWNEPRPVKYFADNYPNVHLHKIEGVNLYVQNSFPSGHTTSAFAFFLVLAYFTKNKALQFLYFILAVLVGYSRVYLSQHFVLDILAGSLIGVSLTILFQLYIEKKSIKWADGSLRDVFLRKRK